MLEKVNTFLVFLVQRNVKNLFTIVFLTIPPESRQTARQCHCAFRNKHKMVLCYIIGMKVHCGV